MASSEAQRVVICHPSLFTASEIDQYELQPITRPILRVAASLRAGSAMRTADAIHAATAVLGGCALFITNDKRLRHSAGLPVAVLDDLLV